MTVSCSFGCDRPASVIIAARSYCEACADSVEHGDRKAVPTPTDGPGCDACGGADFVVYLEVQRGPLTVHLCGRCWSEIVGG